jgi:hypothetical protein
MTRFVLGLVVLALLSTACASKKKSACERTNAILQPVIREDLAPEAPEPTRESFAGELEKMATELDKVEFPDTRGDQSVSALVVAADTMVLHLRHLRDAFRVKDQAARKTDVEHWQSMVRGEVKKIEAECAK